MAMDRDTYIYNMRSFLESDAFIHKHIEEVDGKYYVDDNHPNFVYFKRIDSLKEIDPIIVKWDTDDLLIPTIYISDKPRVIHLIGGTQYNVRNWSLERMNDMQGFEYDYAYLHQCTVLQRDPFCHWPN